MAVYRHTVITYGRIIALSIVHTYKLRLFLYTFKNIWISFGFDVNVNAGDYFVSDLKDCECTEAEIWPRHHDVCSSTYIFRDKERKTSPKNFLLNLLKGKEYMEDGRMNTKICVIWTRDPFKKAQTNKRKSSFSSQMKSFITRSEVKSMVAM